MSDQIQRISSKTWQQIAVEW